MFGNACLNVVVPSGKHQGFKLGALAYSSPEYITEIAEDTTLPENVRAAAREVNSLMQDTGRPVPVDAKVFAVKEKRAISTGDLLTSILADARAYINDKSHFNPDDPSMFLCGATSTRFSFREYTIQPRLDRDRALILQFTDKSDPKLTAARQFPYSQWSNFEECRVGDPSRYAQQAERLFPSTVASIMPPVVQYNKDGDPIVMDNRIRAREMDRPAEFVVEGRRARFASEE